MRVLLVRPAPSNERFGLGPFFRIEPLGMEYIAAALERDGHHVTIRDLRFGRSLEHTIESVRPEFIGVACMHALEIDDALAVVRLARERRPDAFILVGGHAVAAYPDPLLVVGVDAVCLDDGERAVPALVAALQRRGRLDEVPGLLVARDGSFERTRDPQGSYALDEVPLPARHLVDGWRNQYACLHHRPTYLIETARGCPFRCSFCSVWQLFDRGFRERSIDSVCEDFAATGDHIFIADDLFWHHASRSLALAQELKRRGIRKQWILVQSRVDLVANHADLLAAWRPLAKEFDIFFGLEAATNEGLSSLVKDTTVDRTIDGVGVARELEYGVTGNFVIDPAWGESDFERLWAFVERHRLGRAGFTILTPLPGTAYFEEMRPRLRAMSWSQFDMHHVLWEPALGARRFFELYCETWRRSVLNLRGEKKWWQWARHTSPRHLMFMTRALLRSQRMMDPRHYLSEYRLAEPGRQLAAIERRHQRNHVAV
jgi:hopanoid C-3 methylase